MNKEKVEELLKGFPKLKANLRKQMEQSIASWIICDGKAAHCTACKSSDVDDVLYYIHRKRRECPNCHKEDTVLRNYYRFDGVTLESEDNFVVLQNSSKDDNLYISCFNYQQYMYKNELKPRVTVTETQRYIFTDKQAFRYGRDKVWDKCVLGGCTYYTGRLGDEWKARARLTEPRFKRQGFNAYTLIGCENVKKTCMKYSMLEMYSGKIPIEYLKFYQKHRGCERLLKCGLMTLVADSVPHTYSGYYGGYYTHKPKPDIDWKQNEPHKMLGVTKDALKPIADKRISLEAYRIWRGRYPEKPIDKLIEYNQLAGIHDTYDRLDKIIMATGITIDKLISYMKKAGIDINSAGLRDYSDYISDCIKLKYNVRDKGIYFPKNFYAAHDRIAKLRNMIENPDSYVIISGRKDLEFEHGDLCVISPKSKADIVNEGKVLSHCVGGYADRHVNGKLSIMFLRRKTEPDKPYYTIEVGNDCIIKQCRGYKNNVISVGGCEKPEEITEFEKLYQEHLLKVYAKRAEKAKKSKNNRRKTA